jgi:phosphoglucosamine mutase
VLVRASGTENKLRVLVEGPDAARVKAHAEAIAAEIRRALG